MLFIKIGSKTNRLMIIFFPEHLEARFGIGVQYLTLYLFINQENLKYPHKTGQILAANGLQALMGYNPLRVNRSALS